jgi:hypothetical protein
VRFLDLPRSRHIPPSSANQKESCDIPSAREMFKAS